MASYAQPYQSYFQAPNQAYYSTANPGFASAPSAGVYDPSTGQMVTNQTPYQAPGAQTTTQPASSGPAQWSPGSGQITAAQVTSQYGADPSVAQYWADKINSGGDPNYYIGRLQQDNSGSGPDGRGGVSGGGSAGGSFGAALGSVGGPALQWGAPPSVTPGASTSGVTPQTATYQNFDPSKVDVTQDPGYQFRLAQGEKALQNSAAANGTLMSGGFAKALTDYAQGDASQEYQNAFNRAFTTNQANNSGNLAATTENNQAATAVGALNLGYQNSNLNAQEANASNYLQSEGLADQYDLGLRSNALGYYTAGNNFTLGMGQLGLGYQTEGDNNALNWANYGLNANNQNFSQGYQLAGMGEGAATSLGSFGTAFGNGAANTVTGAGNAAAGGSIATGNAISGGINGAGNAALTGYYANQYNQPPGVGAYLAPPQPGVPSNAGTPVSWQGYGW